MDILSENDLAQLTGYKKQKYQINWLIGNGIRFLISADGKPKVLESHLNELLKPNNKHKMHRSVTQPNFTAIEAN